MENSKILIVLSLLFSIAISSETKWQYSCIENLESLIMGGVKKRYKVSNECDEEFLCTMTCIPMPIKTIDNKHYQEKGSKEFNIKLSIGTKLLEQLQITRTKDELSIALQPITYLANISTTQMQMQTTEIVPISESTTPKPKSGINANVSTTPKMPCPCVSVTSATNMSTTIKTTTAKTHRMPCPCVAAVQPNLEGINEETTQELKIKKSSIYDTEEISENTANSMSLSASEISDNCTTDATSGNLSIDS